MNMLLNIQRYIFWLDSNIKNDENQNYLKKLQNEFPSYEIETFDSVESTISYLKKKKRKI